MKIAQHTFVSLDYVLKVGGEVADRSQPGHPLEFVFGAGMLLPKFEEHILGLGQGDKFEFTLTPEEGYGELIPEAVVELPKTVFMIEGKVAEELLTVGNQIPMSDNQGNRMLGRVVEVGAESVKMDFNHPMAGKTLDFSGEIVGVREVTPEDLAPKGGCSCGCDHDSCGGCGHDDEEGCGEGHCSCGGC